MNATTLSPDRVIAEGGVCGAAVARGEVDAEFWFTEVPSPASTSLREAALRRQARAADYCSVCPVALLCATLAERRGDVGIWGGRLFSRGKSGGYSSRRVLTSDELDALEQERQKKAQAAAEKAARKAEKAALEASRPARCDDPRAGSSAGYEAHKKAGEAACRACLDARAAKSRAQRARKRAEAGR